MQLVTIGALPARASADTRVGDENVDAVLGAEQFLGQAPDLLQ